MFVKEGHVVAQLLHGNLGIYLGRGDVGVSEYAADTFDRHACIEGHDGESVACAVESDMLGNAAKLHQPRHLGRNHTVVDGAKDGRFAVAIAVDDVKGYRHQSDDESCAGLLPMSMYPPFAINHGDVCGAEVADVDE